MTQLDLPTTSLFFAADSGEIYTDIDRLLSLAIYEVEETVDESKSLKEMESFSVDGGLSPKCSICKIFRPCNLIGKRYYDPLTSSWIGRDPMDQYPSPYLYVGANPILGVDPDGMLEPNGASHQENLDIFYNELNFLKELDPDLNLPNKDEFFQELQANGKVTLTSNSNEKTNITVIQFENNFYLKSGAYFETNTEMTSKSTNDGALSNLNKSQETIRLRTPGGKSLVIKPDEAGSVNIKINDSDFGSRFRLDYQQGNSFVRQERKAVTTMEYFRRLFEEREPLPEPTQGGTRW